jgi:hypothetical protein
MTPEMLARARANAAKLGYAKVAFRAGQLKALPVATGELPSEIAEVAALYVGCIAGALPEPRYLAIVREAGFADVAIAERRPVVLDDELLAQHLFPAAIERLRASGVALASITLVATRPRGA